MQPAAYYVCNMLDDGLCPGSTEEDLCFADLSKLPEKELAKLCAWMTEKVDAIASGHAQVLMQIDTQLKVCHLLLCPCASAAALVFACHAPVLHDVA